MTHLAAALLEVVDVSRIQSTENFLEMCIKTGAAKEMTIALCRDRKAVGHLDAL